jgi:hypothetical protein
MAYTFSWVPTPGQNNSFVTNNNGTGRAIMNSEQYPFNSPLYICIPPITFQGGDTDAATLYDFARTIATCGVDTTVQNPAINFNGNRLPTGGAFTLNGNPCGRYEYNVLAGGTTLTQAMVATLFSSSLDISTWIVVRGNLTIGSGVTLIPNVNPSYTAPATVTSPDPDAKRRLFMVVYVTGTLAFADSTSIISMTACGGNSSPTGANIGSFDVPIASSVYTVTGVGTNIVSPVISSSGGIGGAGVNNPPSNNGSSFVQDAFNIECGTGGGGGGSAVGNNYFSGTGGNGSCFSGGSGGGSTTEYEGATAGSNEGGAGGTGAPYSDAYGDTVGGTGNPGGTGSGTNGFNGTGGVVLVITEGAFDTGGNIKANGVNGEDNGTVGGGASGGGIIVLIQSSSSNNYIPTREFVGGDGQTYGGNGGAGESKIYGINS